MGSLSRLIILAMATLLASVPYATAGGGQTIANAPAPALGRATNEQPERDRLLANRGKRR